MTMQTLHTLLMVLLVAQSVMLGCTTGKHTQTQPLYLRLILICQPCATGAWLLAVAYLGHWVYYCETALLTVHIFTLYALTALIGRHEREHIEQELSCSACPNFGGND